MFMHISNLCLDLPRLPGFLLPGQAHHPLDNRGGPVPRLGRSTAGDPMLTAYRAEDGKLIATETGSALWIDLCSPEADEVALVAPLVPSVPTLAEMSEIEISSRLYHEGATDVMTVMVPGLDKADRETPIIGPATFLLSAERLVTVRYHAPRPFETYPGHAAQTPLGCGTPARIFLGLIEEIIGRIADLMEGAGRALDEVTQRVFKGGAAGPDSDLLQIALETAGRQSEMVGNCRLSLLSLECALGFFDVSMTELGIPEGVRGALRGLTRDIQSLVVHVDYLSSRISQTIDATLGMINLAQNNTVKILSVVSVLFLPPTLIASIYGMNFHNMPEVNAPWGYTMSIVLMVASAVGAWAFFKWKNWL